MTNKIKQQNNYMFVQKTIDTLQKLQIKIYFVLKFNKGIVKAVFHN